jgi:integration host factor subunit beta
MTKAELIEDVSRVVEMSRKDSEIIVETIFDSIVKSLKAGDKIEIRGFGSFRTRQRKPRIGRNPKTGTRVDVPAKKIPYFKPSKELKDLVNTSQCRGDPCGSTACPARGAESGDSLGVRAPSHGAFGNYGLFVESLEISIRQPGRQG